MSEEKKALMLLKSLIFHYHGLDDDEKSLLESAANKHSSHVELKWANDFIAEDYLSAFERSRDCLLYTSPSPRDQRGSRMPSSA